MNSTSNFSLATDFEISTNDLSEIIINLISNCFDIGENDNLGGNNFDIMEFIRWYGVLSNELIHKFCVILSEINDIDIYDYISEESEFDEFIWYESNISEFYLNTYNFYKLSNQRQKEKIRKNISSIINKIVSLQDIICYNISINNISIENLKEIIISHFEETD